MTIVTANPRQPQNPQDDAVAAPDAPKAPDSTQDTWTHLMALTGGLVAVASGVIDLKTGQSLSAVFDGGLITGGVALIVGHSWFSIGNG